MAVNGHGIPHTEVLGHFIETTVRVGEALNPGIANQVII